MKKQLKFIHITKNAGKSIENIANKEKISWGRFDDEKKSSHFPVEKWGNLNNFTGITSDFEIPTKSEIHLDGCDSIDENVNKIIEYIFTDKFFRMGH
jgi:hypothetical protein